MLATGIQPERVEPAAPVEALQAWQSCASSPETFTKSECAAEDSRSEVGLRACIDRGCPRLQFACAAYEVVLGEVGSLSVGRSCSSGAFIARAMPVELLGRGGAVAPDMARNLCASRVIMRRVQSLSKTSKILSWAWIYMDSRGRERAMKGKEYDFLQIPILIT